MSTFSWPIPTPVNLPIEHSMVLWIHMGIEGRLLIWTLYKLQTLAINMCSPCLHSYNTQSPVVFPGLNCVLLVRILVVFWSQNKHTSWYSRDKEEHIVLTYDRMDLPLNKMCHEKVLLLTDACCRYLWTKWSKITWSNFWKVFSGLM
jgi:hypothetical protein